MQVYILGYNGFIAKNIYMKVKKIFNNVILLTHDEIDVLKNANENDIVINCSGVNRGNNFVN